MSITIPDRSLEQRMAALARANMIRVACADIKRDIRAGHSTVTGVLEVPPEFALRMKVLDLLLAGPGVGPVRAMKLLNRVGISSVKTVGGLTERQRKELSWMWSHQ